MDWTNSKHSVVEYVKEKHHYSCYIHPELTTTSTGKLIYRVLIISNKVVISNNAMKGKERKYQSRKNAWIDVTVMRSLWHKLLTLWTLGNIKFCFLIENDGGIRQEDLLWVDVRPGRCCGHTSNNNTLTELNTHSNWLQYPACWIQRREENSSAENLLCLRQAICIH